MSWVSHVGRLVGGRIWLWALKQSLELLLEQVHAAPQVVFFLLPSVTQSWPRILYSNSDSPGYHSQTGGHWLSASVLGTLPTQAYFAQVLTELRGRP